MRKKLGTTGESLSAAPGKAPLPVIRQMIEAARRHVSAAADLTFVLLCWRRGGCLEV
ncbi:MAG: hypothetical protein HY801_07785 [Candidatus Lindowbacteria bacterium]|nr:hypothetical protein [Candidatus Lindowbacteria bacterium]